MQSGFREALGLGFDGCTDARARMATTFPELRASGRLAVIAAEFEEQRALVPPPAAVPALFARCARCHSDPTDATSAPQIPFDNTGALAGWLLRSGYKRGSLADEIAYRLSDLVREDEQMPPAGGLSPEERKRMIDFLRGQP
jgi:hypothetical protein